MDDETDNQPTIKCLSFHQIDELMQMYERSQT